MTNFPQNGHFQACRQGSPRVANGRQGFPRSKGDPRDGWDELLPDRSYLSHFPTWYSKSGHFPIEIPIKKDKKLILVQTSRESWRPSYSRPKLTLFSRKRRSWGAALKKITRPPENFLCQILARELSKCNLETSLTRIWHLEFSGGRVIFFYASLFLLANRVLPPSPDFGQE